jgi:Cu(I)/Ag(I) efflux system membrane protein CusA/SilA
VINRVKEKITALAAGLPPGVRIVSFYDRSDLIARAVDTLKHALLEETLIVTLAHMVFLMHLRSVLIVTLPLPLAVFITFLGMRYLGSAPISCLWRALRSLLVLVDALLS